MSSPIADRHPLLSDYEQTLLEGAAEDAYEIIAQERERDFDEVHRIGVCHRAAEIMVASMAQLDNVKQQTAEDPWIINGHSHGTMISESGDTLVFDPTWKQFAADDLPEDAPMLLIGSRDEFKQRLLQYGVPASKLHLWDEPTTKS